LKYNIKKFEDVQDILEDINDFDNHSNKDYIHNCETLDMIFIYFVS